jgi:hypothetical protein
LQVLQELAQVLLVPVLVLLLAQVLLVQVLVLQHRQQMH